MSVLPSGTVTFLFTDVEGSTRLLRELGVVAYARALGEHRAALRDVFVAHGGSEVDMQGDACFVAFSRAGDALAAASELDRALADGPIRVRVGIHTGEPLLSQEGYVGIDVHRAARIAAAGHGGQVLVSQTTRDLVSSAELRDLGEHRLKDLAHPERLFQLGDGEFPPLKSLGRTNLPVPSTPFLGREHELAEVVGMLSSKGVRLLTLTGPAGTGKTRLALQAAAEASELFPDGIVWVPLAALRDAAFVLPTVARAVEVPEEGARTLVETVTSALSGKRLLLILDNVEHLLPAAAGELAPLLTVSGPVLLVTSRERLQLQGERLFPVPALREEEGVELFLTRARALAPGFRRDGAVALLCARLDNLPLALELAAARTVVFSPEQLLDRLSQRLDLLKGPRDTDPRQMTLRATMEWSYELLDVEEQRLLRALSVFAGGCDFETAEALCSAAPDSIQSLLDKNLLRRRESSAAPRYWMLETIRAYADEQLSLNGEADAARSAHAGWYIELAERLAEAGVFGDDKVRRFERLDAECDNLRAAFAWAIGEAPREAGRILLAMWEYWYVRDAMTEAIESVAAVLEHAAAFDPLDLGRIRTTAGAIAFFSNKPDVAESQLEDAVRLVAGLPEEIEARRILGYISEARHDWPAAKKLQEQALALARTSGDAYQIRRCLHALGGALAYGGDLNGAREVEEQGVALGLAQNDDLFIAHAAHSLGDLTLRLDDLAEATARYQQAAAAASRVGMTSSVAYCLAGLAAVAARQGEPQRAARLWGAVEAYEDQSQRGILPHERALYEDTLAAVASKHRVSYEQGRSLSVGEALKETLL